MPGPAPESTIDRLLHDLEGLGTEHVRLGGFDVDGVLRGKIVTLDRLGQILASGMGLSDVIFGWDCQDARYNGGDATEGSQHPNLHAFVDPTTLRRVPWDRDIPFFLLDFALPDGSPFFASPRQVLMGQVEEAAAAGFSVLIGAEFQFALFKEDSHSIRDKAYRGLTPLDRGSFGFSALRATAASSLLREALDKLGDFGIQVEDLHPGPGPGHYEAAIARDEALAASDKAALFKTALKEVLAERGVMATFMAKPGVDMPGCSGHTHMSLWQAGEPAFADAADSDGLSATFRSFLAGQQALLPDLMALLCPTINSYKRTTGGSSEPMTAGWGLDDRRMPLRVVRSETGRGTRVENRVVGADCNPYLVNAACLAAGLHGVARGLQLGAPGGGDADAAPLPRTLAEASDRLDASSTMRALLGDAFVDHFVATRRWEVREFERAVTDWELSRYFEII